MEEFMKWLDNILEKEKASHVNFFGKEFDLSTFSETLKKYGENRIREWEALLLEPHFLPKIEIARKADFPGFKIRPSNHCYEVVYQGKVLRVIDGQLQNDQKAHWLLGQSVLIDTRLKPNYENGEQMWHKDNFLGPIIEKLRKQEKIPKYEYGSQSSRFGVSSLDFDNQVKQVLLERLGLSFRHERAIEAIIIPQLYLYMPRKNNGTTNTWVWYEEFFGDCS
ncbi:MAG: hypothetical protein HYW77_02415, partial [Parcubacteria group bacterium]|nr:hypothetical protein [Parcubacteria group bacterium]